MSSCICHHLLFRLSRSNRVAANAIISLFLMPDIPLCVSIEALLWGQHFGVQPPYIPCAPSRGSRAGSFLPRPAYGGSSWPWSAGRLPPISASVFMWRLLFCFLGGHCPWREGPPHPGGPPLRPFPWLLLCVFSVTGILVIRLSAPFHPGGPGPWHTALKPQQVLDPFEQCIFSFPKKPRLTRLC